MSNESDELSRLRQQKDIRLALQQTGPAPLRAAVGARHKLVLGSYLLALIALGVLYYLLHYGVVVFRFSELVQRVTLGAIIVVLVLQTGRLFDAFLIGRIEDTATQYNLRRVLRLVTSVMLALVAVEVLFANWYTAVVSLGLITLIIGFALQTPITSFIGWIFILVRVPFRIGDRIRIGDTNGDVIDIGYLDTTLWEYGGALVSADDPSGRIVRFPNSNVLSSAIVNYSWPLFPFVWNEVKVNVAYQSDLKFVAGVMTQAAHAEITADDTARVALFRELLSATHIDQGDIHEHPVVSFSAKDNSWIEAGVRFLVTPRAASGARSRVLERILTGLNAAPDKAKVPQGDGR
ncbi:MAG: mechanosensitive ion channel family protein [Pyrinomonadaceae bacterium]